MIVFEYSSHRKYPFVKIMWCHTLTFFPFTTTNSVTFEQSVSVKDIDFQSTEFLHNISYLLYIIFIFSKYALESWAHNFLWKTCFIWHVLSNKKKRRQAVHWPGQKSQHKNVWPNGWSTRVLEFSYLAAKRRKTNSLFYIFV